MAGSEVERPLLAVSMGDPAGIGPEIVLKAALDPTVRGEAQLVVFGDPLALHRAAELLSVFVNLMEVESVQEVDDSDGLPVVPVSRLEVDWASPSLASDRAQIEYIKRALTAVQKQEARALVTGPIRKTAMKRAGETWPGHTELLAERCGVERPIMMLTGPSLSVVPLTTHVPLKDVPQLIHRDLIEHVLRVTNEAFRHYFGLSDPRLAVAGLNPHAGEEGMLGEEEQSIIVHAIEAVCADGVGASGPYPADTVFSRAVQGEFDVVIGMYHDQALIPLKLLDFDRGVNVTLGLPIIRTSVDHGTAYDIAGRGVASAESMIEAIRLAVRMDRSAREQS